MNRNYMIPSYAAIGLSMTGCVSPNEIVGDWRATSFGELSELPIEETIPSESGDYSTTSFIAVGMSVGEDYSAAIQITYTETVSSDADTIVSENGGTYVGSFEIVDSVYEIFVVGDRIDLRLDCILSEDTLNCELSDIEEEREGEATFVRDDEQ